MVWGEKVRWGVNADCTVRHDLQVLWHRLENFLVWVRKSCYHSNVYTGEIIYMRKLTEEENLPIYCYKFQSIKKYNLAVHRCRLTFSHYY